MRKTTVGGNAPVRLTQWIKSAYPALPRHALAAALRDRDIKVNGKRVGQDVALAAGDEVTLYLADELLDGPEPEIVWHSDDLVVAVKPQGLLSKAEGEADMEQAVTRWLQKQGEPSEAHACHRLDGQTGGLMLFARNWETELDVRRLMDEGKIVKTYHCVVKGTPSPDHRVLTAYLRKDAERAHVAVLDHPAPGARTAVTEYRVLRSCGECSLMEVTLHTGRTHQIRAHMAHIGHPVLGDDKYGDRELNRRLKARRQLLWAAKLEFSFEARDGERLGGLARQTLVSEAPFFRDWMDRCAGRDEK